MAVEKDRTLFGTKIYNYERKEIGLILYTWNNKFYDNNGIVEIPYVTYVDQNGKTHGAEFENTSPLENMEDEELERIGLTK